MTTSVEYQEQCMDLHFDLEKAKMYKSQSQAIRVLTESWAEANLFCPPRGGDDPGRGVGPGRGPMVPAGTAHGHHQHGLTLLPVEGEDKTQQVPELPGPWPSPTPWPGLSPPWGTR